jgi:hypothetical protein
MVSMRPILLALLAALIAVQMPQSAPAQVTVSLSYIENDPAKLVEAAFSAPYGRLLIAEFAAVLTESADPACLKSRSLQASALAERARSIVLRQGAELVKKFASAVDRAALKTAFASRMGAGADAELAKLRNNPDVRAFLELAAPARDAATANAVVETLDRNMLVLKFKVSRRFDPMATGNQKLLGADPSDSIGDKLDALVKSGKSTALARFIELMGGLQEAVNASTNAKALLGTRIVDLMPGLDKDLADICLLRQQ